MKFCIGLGKSPVDTLKLIRNSEKMNPCSVSVVCRWNGRKPTEDNLRDGRPCIVKMTMKDKVSWLCWGLTSQSTIFQKCRDGAIASWVINQYFLGVKCLAQGHNTAAVGLEPRTSRSGVRHSTTEPPGSPEGQSEGYLFTTISKTLTKLYVLKQLSSTFTEMSSGCYVSR